MADIELSKVVSRVTVQDGVYEQLRHALMWGKFEPAQAITISSLATEFGTSHMPVREALRRLAAEKGLDIARNGSAIVPDVSKTRLNDLCQARIALEGLAAELGVAHVTDEDLERCTQLAREHEEMGRTGEVYPMLRTNQQFHFAIYKLAGSDVLIQLIEVLWLQFGPYMRLLSAFVEKQFGSGDIHPVTPYHDMIIEALRKRDKDAVRELMIRDIQATQSLLLRLCQD
ncbi:GntR family transcriptional regulator [Paraburkholderia aspalathi]|nr:GntR family transcriptional regulator [Paraburkholderia aspalathi]